jgi:NADP-dependent 3-hydroxy acid dehydrogenase YdfG
LRSHNWNKSIAITGAGSGFGAALAHRYAVEGWKVAVTDIDEERAINTLAEVRQLGGDGFSLLLDTTNAGHWRQLEEQVKNRWGGLQVLVNNAGVATAGNIEDTSMENWNWVLDVDLMGVVRGCHQFSRMFKLQKTGHIVNISSFAALAGLPFLVSYGVAKAGVFALSEALRAEMHPHGVGVTVACPAFVKTNLLDTFRSTGTHSKATVMHWMETSGVTAEQIADEIAQAVRMNKFLLLTHAQTKAAWRLKRWWPERYFRQVIKLTKHHG